MLFRRNYHKENNVGKLGAGSEAASAHLYFNLTSRLVPNIFIWKIK